MKVKSTIAFLFILLLFPSTWLFQGCSKGSGSNNGTDTTGFYLSATINGQPWSANLKSTLQNSPAIGVLVTVNNTQLIIGLGLKVGGNDSSGMFIIFPKNITLNQSTPFDSAHYVDAGYVTEASPGSPTFYAYTSSASYGGSGKMTVTALDQTSNIIQGTFSGTFASKIGAAPVSVSNGKFRCPFTTNTALVPPSGSITIKF